jgi:uncharacterized tellurite resistance protein B-like protein
LFKSFKKLFQDAQIPPIKSVNDLELLCGLMIEAAKVDGVLDQQEVNKISKVLIEVFEEDPQNVASELAKCLNELNSHKSLYSYTSKLNQSFSPEKKIMLIEIMWEIILEDGKIHDFESNLIRRLAGLLYISDVQCGNARKKVLKKLQIKE